MSALTRSSRLTRTFGCCCRKAQQGLPGGGGLDAATAAHQQRRADLGLDRGDALAHRRGDNGLAPGGARDVALLADGNEQAQGDGVEGGLLSHADPERWGGRNSG
jgi:hypothetical protein